MAWTFESLIDQQWRTTYRVQIRRVRKPNGADDRRFIRTKRWFFHRKGSIIETISTKKVRQMGFMQEARTREREVKCYDADSCRTRLFRNLDTITTPPWPYHPRLPPFIDWPAHLFTKLLPCCLLLGLPWRYIKLPGIPVFATFWFW